MNINKYPTTSNLVFAIYRINFLKDDLILPFPSLAGKISRFKRDITRYDNDAFGFFYVKVKTPKNKDLNIPILQHRIKNKNGGVVTMCVYRKQEIRTLKSLLLLSLQLNPFYQ
jgi:hypothetical protein